MVRCIVHACAVMPLIIPTHFDVVWLAHAVLLQYLWFHDKMCPGDRLAIFTNDSLPQVYPSFLACAIHNRHFFVYITVFYFLYSCGVIVA